MFGHKRIPSREGGVEIVVSELSRRMAALGHQVTCYNRGGHHVSGAEYDCEKIAEYDGVRVCTVPTVDKKGLAAVSSSFFASVCASFSRADAVHIHAEGPAFMCWLPKLFKKRVVVTVHGLDWQREKWKGGFGSRFIRAGERMAVRYADKIIVLSHSVQQYFMQTYGRETVYIPNGVDIPSVLPAKQISERFGLGKNEYILFLGRLVPEKGVHYLINAFKQLHTEKRLVIAGGASEAGDYPERLYAAAREDARILFTGFVQGELLHELYSNAYIYVQPSDVEGMPLCLLEAMSYGNCCVVSDIPECTEVVEDKALVFQKADAGSLRDVLQRLCDEPALAQKYRQQSSEYVLEKFDWDAVVSRTLELYE
ncbi:MAG: glycosyltransferase family 4 protein [Oscillospiraceae bacterium]|nr:glycosyltransferase family 4 protein [Oscillospiraceae bacterium]